MIFSLKRLIFLCACLLLLVPSLSASSARAFTEGIHVYSIEEHHRTLTITIDATKRVDGKWRQSEVHIQYHLANPLAHRDFDATVILSGDPDQLEVSKDLGWGGLDANIQVQWRRVDCVSANGSYTCGPETVETVPVQLHISVLANQPYREEGGYFIRNADLINPTTGVSGTVTTPYGVTQLQLGMGMHSNGYNFSDQFPG